MSEKKIDRRVIKTKRAIRNAFITLMAQKDVNDISIKDIADAADVDRKTVYNYYNGIYEIREELENDLIVLWKEAIDKLDFEKNISNPQQIFATLTEILNGNLDLYSSLMKLESKSMIIRKLARALTEVVREGLTNNPAIQGNIKKDRHSCAVYYRRNAVHLSVLVQFRQVATVGRSVSGNRQRSSVRNKMLGKITCNRCIQ